MKFNDYLNEEKIDTIIKEIKTNCQPFLKDWRSLNIDTFPYSGRIKKVDFGIKNIRKDRKSKDMPIELHQLLDNWFYKKFGVRARSNSIFVSFDLNEVSFYGMPHLIFPIGNYTAISSSYIRDLYNEMSILYKQHTNYNYNLIFKEDYGILEDKGVFEKKVIEWLEKSKYEKKLKKQKGNEIMIVTDKCFLVSTKYKVKLLEELKEMY